MMRRLLTFIWILLFNMLAVVGFLGREILYSNVPAAVC